MPLRPALCSAPKYITALSIVLLGAACGVHVYPHPTPQHESTDDFAPIPDAGSTEQSAQTEERSDAGVMDAGVRAVEKSVTDAGSAAADSGARKPPKTAAATSGVAMKPDAADDLPDCFLTLATAIRGAIGIPDLPLLFSGYEVGGTGNFLVTNEGPQRVIAGLAKVEGHVPHSAMVPADVEMQDDHHFSLNGHMVWTKRALDLMQAKGWFPWATAKTAASMPTSP